MIYKEFHKTLLTFVKSKVKVRFGRFEYDCYSVTNNEIRIRRNHKKRPNISYFDEICTIAHEFGHFLSRQKKPVNDRQDAAYLRLRDCQHMSRTDVQLVLNEEIRAWNYGWKTLSNFGFEDKKYIKVGKSAVCGYQKFAEKLNGMNSQGRDEKQTIRRYQKVSQRKI